MAEFMDIYDISAYSEPPISEVLDLYDVKNYCATPYLGGCLDYDDIDC